MSLRSFRPVTSPDTLPSAGRPSSPSRQGWGAAVLQSHSGRAPRRAGPTGQPAGGVHSRAAPATASKQGARGTDAQAPPWANYGLEAAGRGRHPSGPGAGLSRLGRTPGRGQRSG